MRHDAKVLFVDDEPHILAAIARKLHRKFAVVTACGAAKGLEALDSDGPFSVVVADMQMPGMDGIQFLQHVKVSQPEAIRIMLTGNADSSTLSRAFLEAGIFRFLSKPCSPEQLADALHEAIGARAA